MKYITTIFLLVPLICFSQWAQVNNSINGSNSDFRLGFSNSISQNGTIIAIGSQNSTNGTAGKIEVFEDNNGTWTQIGADITGNTVGDQTGTAVSISSNGNVVAVGANGSNDIGNFTGKVSVYENINNSWVQIGNSIYGQSQDADAGRSVDLSDDGTIVAVGAPDTDTSGNFAFIGNVRIFERQNNTWVQRGGDINGDGNAVKFGHSVSLSADGNIVAIGQIGDPLQGQDGRVLVYQFDGTQWNQMGSTIFGTLSGGLFGWQLSISSTGNILAVGSYSSNEVMVFEFINGNWSQVGNTIQGENPGDDLGFSVDISDDGTIVTAGARFFTNGSRIGRVYVFQNQAGSWVQVGSSIQGESNGDQNGFSLSMSGNGSRISIGAIHNDSNGTDTGQVRVFENNILNIKDTFNDNNYITIYPNPVKEYLTISSDENIQNYTVISIDGKILNKKNDINLNNFRINMEGLSSGIYMLSLENSTKKTLYKFIKE